MTTMGIPERRTIQRREVDRAQLLERLEASLNQARGERVALALRHIERINSHHAKEGYTLLCHEERLIMLVLAALDRPELRSIEQLTGLGDDRFVMNTLVMLQEPPYSAVHFDADRRLWLLTTFVPCPDCDQRPTGVRSCETCNERGMVSV